MPTLPGHRDTPTEGDSIVIAQPTTRDRAVGDLLIRDLPAATHGELKRRAEAEGMSLQAYVTRLLEQHTERPTIKEWLRSLDDLPRHPELDGAEIVRAAREELP